MFSNVDIRYKRPKGAYIIRISAGGHATVRRFQYHLFHNK